MDASIKWYNSRTIWSQTISFIAWGLTVSKIIEIDSETQQQIVDSVLTITAVITQILSIYYRIKATNKIS